MTTKTPKTTALLCKILEETGVLHQINAPESWVKLCRELETELMAYREGGLTEEIPRRNDGHIKVGKGCIIALASDISANVKVLASAAQEPESKEEADRRLPATACCASSLEDRIVLRCTWCCKDTTTSPCEHCGNIDTISNRRAPHRAEWSRATIKEVECKVCDRRGPYSIQTESTWCDETNNPNIIGTHKS